MLNFTNEAFNAFVQDKFNGAYLQTIKKLIVTRQDISTAPAVIGHANNIRNIENIIVIEGKDFYQSINNINVLAKFTDYDIITYDETSGNIILEECAPPQGGNHVVVFCASGDSLDFTDLFTGVNLVSIDYVGCDIGGISIQGCNSDTFVEADFSNIYDYSAKVLKDISLKTYQNIYFGNHNAIALGVNPFNVKKLILPDSGNETYSIPANCFAGCTNLLEVVIPDCVTSIGDGAFSGCTNLQTVYIGSGVTNIGSKAFNKCTNIDTFIVDPNNTKYVGLTGCLLSRNETPQYTYTMVFANQNWWSGQYTSDFNGIYTMYDANGEKSMPLSFSYGYNQIVSSSRNIKIQVGQVKITAESTTDYKTVSGTVEKGVFITDSNISQYPGNVEDSFLIPVYYWITAIEPDACSGDTRITALDLSRYKSLGNIGQNAFKGCTNITSVTLPDTYTSTNYSGGIMASITIGESAFEGCTGIGGQLVFKQVSTLGKKAFFGCSSVAAVVFNGTSASTTGLMSIGTQAFSNTPNLGSITTNLANGNLGNNFKICPSSNAIYSTSWNGYTNCIVVGCKNTTISNCQQTSINIADYAFYGCSQYNPSNTEKEYFSTNSAIQIGTIGNYAFYGCTSLVLTYITVSQIKSSAFYGCTSITNLQIGGDVSGAKCFANSGVKFLELKNANTLADDAFEGCVLQTVTVNDEYVCLTSTTNTENCLLKKNATNHGTLLKSGDGKDIVNTVWNNSNKVVDTIKDNAFTGVNMNNGTNTTIHIPSSVETVGKNVLSGSKFNNDVTGGSATPTLMLDSSIQRDMSIIICGQSMALLWALGARYFKEPIVRTSESRHSATNHYYTIAQSPNMLTMKEEIQGTVTSDVCRISYNSSTNNITLQIISRLLPGYDSTDNISHIEQLNDPINIVLMENGQWFNTNEQTVYLDSDILASVGGRWLEYSIDNDFPTAYNDWGYSTFSSISDSAFADCKWANSLRIGRRIVSGDNMFKGCTKITTVGSNFDTPNYDCDASIFDGVVQKGMFEGCTSLTGIVSSASGKPHPVPIKIKQNAFKDCSSLNSSEILALASEIGPNSFENNTGLTEINLPSVTDLDATAFVGCNLSTAKADSPCGYYFTGYGNCIVDKNYKIVVGSANVNLNINLDNTACKGIGDEAFTKRQYRAFVVLNNNKTGFTIGKNAFSGSNITMYKESLCSDTVLDSGAFKNCTSLGNVTLLSGCKLGKESFSGCTNLTITLPTQTDIPESCFSNCTSLTQFSIGGNIAKSAFNGCSSLGTVTMCYNASSSATIDSSAFNGCPVSTIEIGEGCSDSFGNYYIVYGNGTSNTCVGIYDKPKETIVIGAQNVANLGSTNINTIGANAYNGRGIVGAVTIPPTVTRIEDYAFANNPGITKVIIPSTVEYIGKEAFSGCTGLLQATLPDSCNTIGDGAFKGCPLTLGFNMNNTDKEYHSASGASGQSIDAASGVLSTLDLTKCTAYSSVGTSAFENSGINIVRLPETCVSINDKAFSSCNRLTELHINSANLGFGLNALYGCSSLRDVYFHKNCTINGTRPNGGWCYEVGSSATHKTIHIPQSMNNSTFTSSYFYADFQTAGYTFVVDM